MTIETRLARIEAALGHVGEPGTLVVFVAADDGVPRTAEGEAVDLSTIDPATLVFVYAEVAVGRQPAAAPPQTER